MDLVVFFFMQLSSLVWWYTLLEAGELEDSLICGAMLYTMKARQPTCLLPFIGKPEIMLIRATLIGGSRCEMLGTKFLKLYSFLPWTVGYYVILHAQS